MPPVNFRHKMKKNKVSKYADIDERFHAFNYYVTAK